MGGEVACGILVVGRGEVVVNYQTLPWPGGGAKPDKGRRGWGNYLWPDELISKLVRQFLRDMVFPCIGRYQLLDIELA